MAEIGEIKSKVKNFWQKHEGQIMLIIGLILVAVIAFEAGILKGKNFAQKPLIIERPAIATEAQNAQNTPSQASNLAPEAPKTAESNNIAPQSCAFVGSKNSNKYHLPTCQWAKRIKPENIVCFKSAEDAIAKGYQPDKGCIK